jgi:hypothetical protein
MPESYQSRAADARIFAGGQALQGQQENAVQNSQTVTETHQGKGRDIRSEWNDDETKWDKSKGKVNLNVKVFPPDLGMTGKNANYMQFSTFIMRGGVGSSTSDINFEGPHEFICLPIPSGIGATYEQGWDQTETNLVQSAAQMGVETAMNKGATITSAADQISAQMKSAAGSGKAILGTVGKVIMGEGAAQRASGRATFSNTYVTYTGPAFRDFTYTFSLKALAKSDSNTIRTIVEFFKINSAPRQLAGNLMRIYELPKLFGISYHGRNGPMEHMNKIAKCALTNVSVVYGGDRFSVFSDDSAPVQVDLTLQFKEVQLLAQSDMKKGY